MPMKTDFQATHRENKKLHILNVYATEPICILCTSTLFTTHDA